jgi:hypothetical protein
LAFGPPQQQHQCSGPAAGLLPPRMRAHPRGPPAQQRRATMSSPSWRRTQARVRATPRRACPPVNRGSLAARAYKADAPASAPPFPNPSRLYDRERRNLGRVLAEFTATAIHRYRRHFAVVSSRTAFARSRGTRRCPPRALSPSLCAASRRCSVTAAA